MKKLIFASLLAMSVASSIVIAKEKKEPTIAQTVGFLQKVFAKDSIYSDMYIDDGNYYTKPLITYLDNKNECKLKIEALRVTSGYMIQKLVKLDLSIHEIYLDAKNNMVISDRNGLKQLEYISPFIINHINDNIFTKIICRFEDVSNYLKLIWYEVLQGIEDLKWCTGLWIIFYHFGNHYFCQNRYSN